MEALIYLTGIAIILIIGIIATIIAKFTKTSNLLFLIISGLIIGNTSLIKLSVFHFSETFLIGLAILTLSMIIFDGSSRVTLREFDKLSIKALELSIVFILFNIIFVTTIINIFYYGFTSQGILLGIILAVILSGTDPASTFILLGDKHNKILDFLKIESVLNTPIMVLIPFLLLDIIKEINIGKHVDFVNFLTPFLQQIIVGLGTGVLIGVIIFKIMRRWYSENLSPVAIIAAALLSYILAENLGGNGVLSVATLGLLFGNTYVKQRGTLQEFSGLLSFTLQILVFILVGIFFKIPSNLLFWIISLIILLLVLICRYFSITIITDHNYNFKERIFMTLNMTKGIALAVVALALAISQIEGLSLIVNFMIIISVYTLIIGSITDRYGKYFLKLEIIQKN